ncbi:hypothetical protein [Patulibacter sp.]|uniref:poly(ethylene terephthalate) hydrolase family protein n=1 Tax=Patulibacter sp. TaxID=1912859 RepID=UPI002726F6DC|nr:hypothetical protein [Patulibacter sp.]MDO9407691.1 hypothetical protein [Patulibacter sp.]
MLLATLGALLASTGVASADTTFPSTTIADPTVNGPYGSLRAEFDFSTYAAAGIADTDGDTNVSPTDKITVGVSGRPAIPASGTTPAVPAVAPQLLDARLAGDIHLPAGGSGPYPVLVFVHGNHSTCQSRLAEYGLATDPGALFAAYSGGTCTSTPAAADEALEIDAARSYQGYDYLAAKLATQGYIVVSLDVNDITAWSNNANRGGYLGRTQLMSRALDMVEGWNTHDGPNGIGGLLKGRVDTSRVGVMGHSRGGEAVNLFAAYNASRPRTADEAASWKLDYEPAGSPLTAANPDFGKRYALKAVFSLAPVDGQGALQPEFQDVAFATALPACDGDVFNLQGAPVFERNRRRISASGHPAIQFTVQGANHNFFNTVWTNDDANLFGFGDPHCNVKVAPTRLTYPEQKRVGVVMMGGFLRRYVGDERQFDPIVRGEGVPASICPDEDPAGDGAPVGITCRNVLQTAYVAAAPDVRPLLDPTTAGPAPEKTPTGEAVSYTGFTAAPTACVPSVLVVTTTGCGASPNRSPTAQLTLSWAGAASLDVALGASGQDVSAFRTLTFRAGVNFLSPLNPPDQEQVALVTLKDASGLSRTVRSDRYSSALQPHPGTTARKELLSSVRIPLSEFTGLDLTKVVSVSLGFGGATPTGEIQLTGLAFQEPKAAVASVPGGPTGPAGPAGPSGADGATGPAGPSGPTGATGPAGPSGPSGATGPAGADGATGTSGAAGATGSTGPTGPTGATGPAGPDGAGGATGATGPGGSAGADGAPGATGAAGRTFLSVRLPATRTIRLAAGSRGIPLRVRCATACRATATVRLTATVARRLGLGATLTRANVRLTGGRARSVALRLSTPIARRVRGQRVRVTITARDAAGATATSTRTVRLR